MGSGLRFILGDNMEIPLLAEMVVIFGLSTLVLLLFSWLRLPAIVGLLLTGIVCGPHGLRFVHAVHEVEILAEVGIVLLLFTIGLEFSLKKLWKSKRQVLLGGGLQVGLTMALAGMAVKLLGLPTNQAIFFGCAIALSSTAITLKILQEKAQVGTASGRMVVSILIFQDMAAVPMILATPLLAGVGGDQGSVFLSLLQGVTLLAAVFVAAQSLVPRLLFLVAKTKNYQLFLLFLLLLCFSTAWLTSEIGLSLALGAFLAGLIVSESEYSDHAVGHILPFQAVFSSFFFVSVGMLLDLRFVAANIAVLFPVTLLILMTKVLIASGVTRLLGYSLRASLLVGLGVCQVGEFAFILLRQGVAEGLVGDFAYQLLLSVSIATMILTPFLIQAGPWFVNRVYQLPIPDWILAERSIGPELTGEALSDHTVIIGFGVAGRHIAWASKQAGIDYNVVELNPETVRVEREQGENIHFGDATHEAVLRKVRAQYARLIVIVIDDPTATRGIIESARRVAPHSYILVRTRYLKEIEPLLLLGADDVIPEEFETSVEVFSRVLSKYLVPSQDIRGFCAEARSRHYQKFRTSGGYGRRVEDLKVDLPDMRMEIYRLPQDSSLVGKALSESSLREKYGVNLLMVRRGEGEFSAPSPSMVLEEGDHLAIFGDPKKLTKMFEALEGEG